MKLEWDLHELVEFGERLCDINRYEQTMENATRELAKAFHMVLKSKTPVVTGKLKNGWDNSKNLSFTVQKVKDGYMVELVNEVEYAQYVNHGHYSHNQYNKGGEPYLVRNRVKVPTRSQFDTLNVNESRYVFGHFFVENSIAEVEEKLDKIISKELQKWLEWCVSGK